MTVTLQTSHRRARITTSVRGYRVQFARLVGETWLAVRDATLFERHGAAVAAARAWADHGQLPL